MVKINVAYSTVRFQKPEGWKGDRRGVFVLPPPPGNQFALLLPIEDDQWTISLGVQGDMALPRNHEEFTALCQGPSGSGRLRTGEGRCSADAVPFIPKDACGAPQIRRCPALA